MWLLSAWPGAVALEDWKQVHYLKPYVVPGVSSSQAHRGSLQTALYGDNSPATSLLSSSPHLNHLRWNNESYNGVNSERESLGYIKRETIFVATIFLLINRALHFDIVKLWSHKDCCSPLYVCQVYLLRRNTPISSFLIFLTVPFLVWRQYWTKTTKVYTSSL